LAFSFAFLLTPLGSSAALFAGYTRGSSELSAPQRASSRASRQLLAGSNAKSTVAPLEPGKSELHEFDIDRYGTFRYRGGDKLAGHELLQNAWLKRRPSAMPRSSPSESTSYPLRIVARGGMEGAFLGGRPPRGASPPLAATPVRFFASFPLPDARGQAVSLFVADFEALLPVRGQLNGLGLVAAVVHQVAPRARLPAAHDSMLTPRRLERRRRVGDQVDDGEGAKLPARGSKLGGAAHLLRPTKDLATEMAKAGREGFVHFAQFDFPSADDAEVSGDWPFGDGVFCLFGRPPYGPDDFRWYWDF
jgi:hypothetical protein